MTNAAILGFLLYNNERGREEDSLVGIKTTNTTKRPIPETTDSQWRFRSSPPQLRSRPARRALSYRLHTAPPPRFWREGVSECMVFLIGAPLPILRMAWIC